MIEFEYELSDGVQDAVDNDPEFERYIDDMIEDFEIRYSDTDIFDTLMEDYSPTDDDDEEYDFTYPAYPVWFRKLPGETTVLITDRP